MTANKLRGEILVTLAGKEYTARLTVNSIMQIESACGMGILKLATKMGNGYIMMTHIIDVLTPALRGGGNDLQREDVIKLVQDAGIVRATAVVGQILTESLTDNSEEAAEGKQEQGE